MSMKIMHMGLKKNLINKGEGGLWCSTKEKKGRNEGMGLKMGQRRKEVRRVNVRQG